MHLPFEKNLYAVRYYNRFFSLHRPNLKLSPNNRGESKYNSGSRDEKMTKF